MASVEWCVRTGTSTSKFQQGEYYQVQRRVDAVYVDLWFGTDVVRSLCSEFRFGVEPPANHLMQKLEKTIAKSKIASDGGSTKYYDLPKGVRTLYDLIEQRPQGVMNFSEGNVFKAVWRMGSKEGIDDLYDWRKIKFAAEREIARLEKLKG